MESRYSNQTRHKKKQNDLHCCTFRALPSIQLFMQTVDHQLLYRKRNNTKSPGDNMSDNWAQ